MKPLPLQLIPSQVPLTKIYNFSNNYGLIHIPFAEKVPQGLPVKNLKTLLKGCFSNQHSKEFLCRFSLKNGITHKKVCLW